MRQDTVHRIEAACSPYGEPGAVWAADDVCFADVLGNVAPLPPRSASVLTEEHRGLMTFRLFAGAGVHRANESSIGQQEDLVFACNVQK